MRDAFHCNTLILLWLLQGMTEGASSEGEEADERSEPPGSDAV